MDQDRKTFSWLRDLKGNLTKADGGNRNNGVVISLK